MGIMLGKFLSSTLLRVPRQVLSGVIIALCVTGAFAMGNSVFNIWVMIFFGIIGYVFNKLKLPHSPLILAIVLGPMMELNFLQSMVLSKGSPMIFVTRPISLGLLIIALFFFATPFINSLKDNLKRKNSLSG